MGHFGALGREVGWRLFKELYRQTHDVDDLGLLYHRAEAISRIVLSLIPARMSLLEANIASAFPHWSAPRRSRTAREAVRRLTRSVVDVFHYRTRAELLKERTTVSGMEHYETALRNGKGAILATAHFGAFPFVGMPFLWRGLPYGIMERPPHDKRVADLMDRLRNEYGMTTVPDTPPVAAGRLMFKVLRENGAMMMPLDIYPGDAGGPEVDFLGRKTLFFTGATRLAARTGAPIVPTCVFREPDGWRHRIVAWPPVFAPGEAAERGSEAERATTALLAGWLSGVIRECPEEWFWLHRLWR